MSMPTPADVEIARWIGTPCNVGNRFETERTKYLKEDGNGNGAPANAEESRQIADRGTRKDEGANERAEREGVSEEVQLSPSGDAA